jgi:hypothetical protein
VHVHGHQFRRPVASLPVLLLQGASNGRQNIVRRSPSEQMRGASRSPWVPMCVLGSRGLDPVAGADVRLDQANAQTGSLSV